MTMKKTQVILIFFNSIKLNNFIFKVVNKVIHLRSNFTFNFKSRIINSIHYSINSVYVSFMGPMGFYYLPLPNLINKNKDNTWQHHINHQN